MAKGQRASTAKALQARAQARAASARKVRVARPTPSSRSAKGEVPAPAARGTFGAGTEYLRAGKLAEAEAVYRGLLKQDPRHAEAWHHLGIVEGLRGRHQQALEMFGKSLELQPGNAVALHSAGVSLYRVNRLDEAVARFEASLALKSDHPEALVNLGGALLKQRRHADAASRYQQALDLRPGYADAMTGLARSLAAAGRHAEAISHFEQALAAKPGDATARLGLAQALAQAGRHREASEHFEKVIAQRPKDPETLLNLAIALMRQKRFREAVERLNAALAVRPEYVEALNSLGNALVELNRHAEAEKRYGEALKLRPEYPEALNNLGNSLLKQGKFPQALARYQQALELRPGYPEAQQNAAAVLVLMNRHGDAIPYLEASQAAKQEMPNALGMLATARSKIGDWRGYDEQNVQIAEAVRAGRRAISPFAFLNFSEDPQDQRACAEVWAKEKFGHVVAPPFAPRKPGERIRIAYLSADFHRHATGYLMAELFELHDRKRFEILGVTFGPETRDTMRARLAHGFDRFIDIRQISDEEGARYLRSQEIDIAVDLKGYTLDARSALFAWRAAPIQVNYLGYPGTLGASCIDYVLGDRWVTPPGEERYYAEKIVRLPGSYQVNDTKRRISPQAPGRAQLGLPERGFVFCCFNNPYKLNPRFFDIWMRLLGKVPGSVLWLLRDNDTVEGNLRREAQARGVDPARIVFAPKAKLSDHLARHRHADLFLDTLPYNAHTTTSDALWAGLPVLTCPGRAFAGRVAASLIDAAGLPELITANLEEYEALALKLAGDPAALGAIRAKILRTRSGMRLFDTRRFCSDLERAYLRMYELHGRGEAPQSFDVPE